MKTIISSTGNDIKSQFDLRFGRAAYFCLIDDTNLDNPKFYNNHIPDSSNNAGINAAKKALELKATKIISGEFGQESKKILDDNNIQIIMINDGNCTINDIIKRLKKQIT